MKNSHSGFTLIETFVAVSILAVSVVAPLSLASRSLAIARYSRDQVVATHLAQDAIEYVRAKRDANLLGIARTGLGNWVNGLTISAKNAALQPFIVDSVYDQVIPCSGTCAPLKFDASTGLYTYTLGKASIYTRTVTLVRSATEPLEATLTVTVTWRSGGVGGARRVVIEDELYGWIPEQN
jgi:type II secretory pathway pseudopilin PulG